MSAPLLAIGFSTPLGFLLGLALVPIVVLFLLKRRYRDLPVGSTMLWANVLEDLLARAPFRRPTEWLSLLLLVAAIVLATLAAAGMRLGVSPGKGRSVVMVLDATASMATEVEGESRFELARAGASDTIDGLDDLDSATLIEAGREPRILSHATDDYASLRAALSDAAVGATGGDLVTALEIAIREAEGASGAAEVLVFSDFAMDAAPLAAVDTRGVPVTLVQCGEEAQNAGIVHASVSSEQEGGRLLVGVAASGDQPLRRTLAIYRNDQLVDARDLLIEPGGVTAELFDVRAGESFDSTRYHAALEPGDALTLDDRAYLGVAANPPPRILHVGDEDPFIERMPRVFPGLMLERVPADDLQDFTQQVSNPFDLAILTEPPGDGVPVPAALEFYIGCTPPGIGIETGTRDAEPVVLEWQRSHPWLRSVGFENLLILQSRRLELPGEARILLRTSTGPQLVMLETRDRKVVVWASEMNETNWALTPAFPLFVRNLLGGSLGGVRGFLQEVERPLHLNAGLGLLKGTVEVVMTSPDDESQSATLWSREDFFWQGPTSPGWYTLEARAEADGGAEAITRHVGLSLFSRAETTAPLTTPDPETFAASGVRAVPIQRFQRSRPIWHWLVAAAILLLACEMSIRCQSHLQRIR